MTPAELLALYEGYGFRNLYWERTTDLDRFKGPRDKGWNDKDRVYDLALYDPAKHNLGVFLGHEVRPGQFLCDVDFDCADIIPLAQTLLPPTDFGFGRASRRVSHGFYTMPTLPPTIPYKDIDNKTTLFELRGGDSTHETTLPPSLHPSGEAIEMRSTGIPAHVPDLLDWANDFAIGGLIFRHTPRGLHHDGRLALSGFLLRLGLSEERILRIGQAICREQARLGIPEMTEGDAVDMKDALRSTATRLASKAKKVAGSGVLAKLMDERGKKVIERICEWVGAKGRSERTSGIERLNERFAIVSVGNKVVVMETAATGDIRQLWPFEEFKRLLVKEQIKVITAEGVRTIKLAEEWLGDPDGRRYERLVYAMPGSADECGPDDYNGYLGFTVRPEPGDWSKNRDHLLAIICHGNEEHFKWLLNWMAALVQFPGRHAFTAIVLRGGQGTGKGHFAHLMLGALFHKQQYLHILGAGMLTGRFNEHLSGKVYVFADESTWGGDAQAAEKLKGMVTESTIPIERKFLPLVEEPSALHIVIASNNEWPISIPMDDRRFFVLDVAETKRQDDSYFTPLRVELRDGGLAAMLHELLAHKIDEHALRHPPSTKGKREVMTQSLKPIERWWFELLLRGAVPRTVYGQDSSGGPTEKVIYEWPTTIEKEKLHDNYMQFLDRHRAPSRGLRATETELGMFLSSYTPLRKRRGTTNTLEGTRAPERSYFWDLPSLLECRAFWAAKCKWPEDFEWDEEVR